MSLLWLHNTSLMSDQQEHLDTDDYTQVLNINLQRKQK